MNFIPSFTVQRFLYNAGIKLYGRLIKIASFQNSKAKKFIEGRKNVLERLKQDVVLNENYIWFHCSSLGEFEQGRPVIEKIRKELPHFRIVLTFFSPSGYEIRQDYEHADEIYYLPLDTPSNAYQFVKILQPKLAIFIKYDFWYNYLVNLNSFAIPTLLVSASFRPDQHFFRKNALLPKAMLTSFDHIFVQDQQSIELLNNIDIQNVTQIPDTRVDRVYSLMQNVRNFPSIEQFTRDYKIIIGGSTYEEEEQWLEKFLRHYDDALRIILAPHDTSPKRIHQIRETFGNKLVLYSQLDKAHINATKKVLLIDQVGFLSNLYQYGNLALIGGGFRKSIHNILEPATFGLPILFGPNYHTFNEAKDLVKFQGAFSINSYDNFRSKANELLHSSANQKTGKICKDYIERNRGGTIKVYQYIINELQIPEIRNYRKS